MIATATKAMDRSSATQRAKAFIALQTPLIEETLTDVVSDVAPETGLRDAVLRAVGTDGRGGRRWRPVLTLAAARACGGSDRDAARVAVAVELTHTASLVLDDMPCMDDDEDRRGQPSTHRLVGPAGAILVAIGLLGRAAQLMASEPGGSADLAEEWGRVIGWCGMAGGQAVDLMPAADRRGHSRRLHREKTTALSALSLSAGARAARASTPARDALYAWGRDLGWSYQLLDDAVDRTEDARSGRPPGGRNPLRQSQVLQDRADRRLRATGLFADADVDLLVALGSLIAPRTEAAC